MATGESTYTTVVAIGEQTKNINGVLGQVMRHVTLRIASTQLSENFRVEQSWAGRL